MEDILWNYDYHWSELAKERHSICLNFFEFSIIFSGFGVEEILGSALELSIVAFLTI